MLEPIDDPAPGEVDKGGIDDPIEEAGLDVIKDPEADVVVLATLLVVKDETMELTGEEDLLVLTKDEPVEVVDKAGVLMLLGLEVDTNEEPAELVGIEEPGEVLPLDEALGEETGTDEFAALVALGVEAKDDPAGVVERDTIELPLGIEEPLDFGVVIELAVPLANEEEGRLVLPMEYPTGEDANDEPVVLVEDDAKLEAGLVKEEPTSEDAKDEAGVLVEDDLGLETGLVMEEPTAEDGSDEAVAPVEDDRGLEAGLVMEELVRVDIKDDPFGPPLDDVEIEPGLVIEDPAGADVVDESELPELNEGDDATEVTEDPLEDNEIGLETAGIELIVDAEVEVVEAMLVGWLERVLDMVVSMVVVSFGQLQGALTGPQYIALKERASLALSNANAISFGHLPMACNCLKCTVHRPNRSPPAS